MLAKFLHRITPYIGFFLFLAAIFIVHGELKSHTITEVMSDLKTFSPSTIIIGILLTGVNYLLLTGYDFLALRYLGKTVPARNAILASLISFSLSNNTGQAVISGSSMRYRFYSNWGLSGLDIVKFSLFLSLTYMLGATTLFVTSVAAAMWSGETIVPITYTIQGAAWFALVGLAAYWLVVFFRREPFSLQNMEVRLPTPGLSLSQTLIAVIDLLFSSLILYLFLKAHVDISFKSFLSAYIVAQMLGLFSQVPGGLGVFEGSFLVLLGEDVSRSQVFASLLVFRVVYYLLPLAVSAVGLLAYELHKYRMHVRDNVQIVLGFFAHVIPHILSILLLISGGLLLVSGATPINRGVMKWLYDTLPLTLVETSHLVGSIVGVLLIFMARAVRLRIDAAYFGVLSLLAAGAAASLLKGADWQEALVMLFLMGLFLPSRQFFYRKSSLLTMPFTWSWIGSVGIIVVCSAWIGLFSYRHVEYSNALWWQFAYMGDASRFLRSSLVVVIMILSFSAYRLLRVQPQQNRLPDESEISDLEPLVKQSPSTQSYLALLGDKTILWDPNRESFLMYGTTAKYWIAMGDPVGPPENHETLVWRFRELADQNGAGIAFYQVSKDNLPLYLDLGLVPIKVGEEALVPLQDFDLKGKRRSGLRYTRNKFDKLDLEFEILDLAEVRNRIDRLSEVSAAWLGEKKTEEKGFSLGFFSEDYLLRTRCGVITRNGDILAFANLWESSSREELSLDLMRYTPEAPGGIMEYLFIRLLFWGKEQGYQWFNLGMSPLSGLERHHLAPLWHKIGNSIFKYGADFYNFEGLHTYKEKFGPVWEPRYLAAPTLKAPYVLMAVTGMIAGGWKGVLMK